MAHEPAYNDVVLLLHRVRVPQEPQSVEEEQGETTIEDFDQVTKQSEHLVDLVDMPLPNNTIGSSETKDENTGSGPSPKHYVTGLSGAI